MSARDHVLGAIRRGLGRSAEDPAQVDARIAAAAPGPIPASARGADEALQARFAEKAAAASAEVVTLAGAAGLPETVAGLARGEDRPAEAAVAPDPVLARLDWGGAGIAHACRAARDGDRICVSRARCGVAETGTLVMTSGPESPATLNFLGEIHVVLLERERIVGAYEDAWALLRADGPLPRAVHWITGPSRSADIEQTLQLGAHGPVRLVVALAG